MNERFDSTNDLKLQLLKIFFAKLFFYSEEKNFFLSNEALALVLLPLLWLKKWLWTKMLPSSRFVFCQCSFLLEPGSIHLRSAEAFCGAKPIGPNRLCSTEEAFLLHTQQLWAWIPAPPRFLSLLLSLWAVLRSNPSSAERLISEIQLAMTSRAKYYKKVTCTI